jgi:tetratricopeptide (TPR) repeat protein
MADDPYSRLKALAEQGRLLRAIAAHEQLAIAPLEPDPQPLVVREPETDDVIVARVRWLLHHRSYAPALVAIEPLLARDNGLVAYLYGRALYGLGRLVEARASFDRACALQPLLIEAQLLRREVDRSLKHVRTMVGVQPPIELGVPEHLAELRDVIGKGDVSAAIERLAQPIYADDPIAQLILGNCLAFERRFEAAIAAYARVTSSEQRYAARLATAQALLALGRADEARPLFEEACAECPDDVEARDGRDAAALRIE